MANERTCQYYNQCGLVKFVQASRIVQQNPGLSETVPGSLNARLPQEGDCGIPASTCLRLNSEFPDITPITRGVSNQAEFDLVFPQLEPGSKKRLP